MIVSKNTYYNKIDIEGATRDDFCVYKDGNIKMKKWLNERKTTRTKFT